MDERQEFFSNFAKEGEDDLLDELAEMQMELDQAEADKIMGDMENPMPGPIIGEIKPQNNDPMAVEEDEEQELKRLMMGA